MKLLIVRISTRVLIKYCVLIIALPIAFACKKQSAQPTLQYYEIGMKTSGGDWKDRSFIVATADASLMAAIDAQLLLPVAQRKMVSGVLVAGSGGYNTNGQHEFAWHFKEDDWNLAEVTAEIYDGRPYSDVDVNITYWLDTVKRFAPWQSYVKSKQ